MLELFDDIYGPVWYEVECTFQKNAALSSYPVLSCIEVKK